MNQNKYLKAEQLIKSLNIWIDDKNLLLSVVTRAQWLEKEVLDKQKEIDCLTSTKLEDLGKCCYKGCNEEATTKGLILARNPDGGKDNLTTVQACDKHKNVPGFI